MATFKYDPATGAYTLVDDTILIPNAGPSVTSDQADYAPGSVATFTASNVTLGGTVEFIVAHDNAGADGIVGTADDVFTYDLSGTTQPWFVTDGGSGDLDGVANGIVETSWNVGQDAANQAFLLSAVDTSTGVTSTISFTDKVVTEPTQWAYTATHIELAASSGVTDNVAGLILANEGAPLNTFITSSGTGQFGTLVEVQNDGAEQGYNTIDNDSLDTKNSNVFNHALQLTDLQAVHSDGSNADTLGPDTYYVFRLDLHQNNNRFISLDDLQLWQSQTQLDAPTNFTAGASTPGAQPSFSFTAASGATQVYDLNSAANEQNSHPNSILLNSSFTAGSGGGADLVVLVPTSDFDASNGNFIYLYSAFGYQGGGWQANSTFEEWGALLNQNVPPPPPPTPHATLSLTKDTVCPDDHQSVALGTLLTGQAVEWTYTVQDTGDANSYVTGLTLVDGPIGTLYDGTGLHFGATLTGDGNGNGRLDAGETWVFTVQGTTTEGNYSNTGTITGTGGNTVDATTDPGLSAFDVSGYTGVTVTTDSIKLTKYVSVDGGVTWVDANDPTGPTLLQGHGDPQYKFTIANSSDVALSINLLDVGLNVDQTVTVDGGSSTDITVSGTWAAGQQTNTASISASFTDDCDNTVSPSSSDVANYFGANPSLTISKDIICPDDGDVLKADTSINLLKDADGKVEYRITVTNTGNVAFVNPVVSDSKLTLGTHTDTETGTGTAGDNTLDVGETWTYTVLADWVAGGPNTNTADVSVSYTDSASNSFTDDPTDSAIYFGLAPHITLDKKTNGADSATVLVGQAITWTYAVTNDGNVGLTGVGVSDNNGTIGTTADDFAAATVFGSNSDLLGSDATHNIGDLNNNGVLDVGETWQFSANGIAGATAYTNIGTATTGAVTDDCGDSTTPTATDTSSYTPIGVTLAGLTKGYWSTHLTLWDASSGDEKGAGSEINVTPKYDWDHDTKTGLNDLSTLTTTGPASSLGLVKGANNGGGDSGLLMGDLNHDGLVGGDGTSDHLFFDLASAQILANSSVSGDARIILASQAIAAQLNEYNDFIYDQAHGGLVSGFDASPTGLIEEAVSWMKGSGPFSNGDSKINFWTANDLASPAVQAIINDAAGTDYTLSGSAITFKSTSMSSSDASWSKLASTGFSYKSDYIAANKDSNPANDVITTVYADGEGLKNALAAYNHGLDGSTGGFVISTDGSLIGWQDSLGGTVYDVHANTTDAFWGILEDQNLIGLHPIAGIANHA